MALVQYSIGQNSSVVTEFRVFKARERNHVFFFLNLISCKNMYVYKHIKSKNGQEVIFPWVLY